MRIERVIRISFAVLAAACVAAAAWLSLRMLEQVRRRPPRPAEVLGEIEHLLPEQTRGLTHGRGEALVQAADALFGPDGSSARSHAQPVLDLLDHVDRAVLVRVKTATGDSGPAEQVLWLLWARDGIQAILDAMAERSDNGSLVTRLYAPGRMELQLPGRSGRLTALRGDQVDGVAEDILLLGRRDLLDALPRSEPPPVVARLGELIAHVPADADIWHVGTASEPGTRGWALWSVRLPEAWRGWVGLPDRRTARLRQGHSGSPAGAIEDLLLADGAPGSNALIDEVHRRQDGMGLEFRFLIPISVQADPPADAPLPALRGGAE